MKKVALVTGATSGIGRALVELLLKEKIHVIAVARNEERAQQVKASLAALTKEVSLDFVIGDFKNNQTTKKVSEDISKLIKTKYEGHLDILMNVAGIVSSGYHENEDGNEVTFAVNHLSPYILTHYMIPFLKASKDPYILVVSSLSHYRASINWNNIQNKKFYNILKAYKRSKLYNVFFVKALADMFPDIKTYAIDPGLVKTEIGLKNTSKLAAFVWKLRISSGTDAYYPTKFMVDIILNQGEHAPSGSYMKEGRAVKSNPITYEMSHAKKLMDYSATLTGLSYQKFANK
jgi:NAD(P)-dependent dehydrogenase (short-subunit alcohol dehydrogenase family)